MDKEDNYSVTFTGLDYSLNHHHHHQQQDHELIKSRIGEGSGDSSNGMIDYMLNNPHPHQQQLSYEFCISTSLDKLSFADVMQFSDFGPKLALNQTKISEVETGIDPVYFLKFPVLNDKREGQSLMVPQLGGENEERFKGGSSVENKAGFVREDRVVREEVEARTSDNTSVQLQLLGDQDLQNKNPIPEAKNKRKRPRTIKTSEEVESQRMAHIAVERNRRKQMNEHLRVLRSLMPGSCVQRGDHASIIGGAIEFVRELEQLLQCLESQKRRRLYGEASRQMGDSSLAIQQPQPPLFPPLPLPDDHMKLVDFETELREETAENKSCLADVEVKLLGFDAMIKILSRRRPGQLINTIAALEELELNILHINITTIEQTVLYSFNVKIESESRFTAEDIASSVQQIFNFIHANSSM
ncbi:transcription factor FAMA-like isoform X2 [Hevea brasiliensis]|uniref:transcription factor FAMA isoform X2 n=1 Tax=Hevea brasiliensis TaxID=3981 RepID=UPI0025E81362|nr:transcription factor FAMA isoform X2 [Hevea brasiliensis]XP_021681832.2 transcription factor FAMA isoform X2 [Hevea brasiliensis]XP_058001241.1 transcription factor FAMA-like isoform X2 [Hevea brasiliensis]XP_058001242.1 transcription factor FAMA-like isoform X2 [Hevea brasiliensis]